MLLILVQYHECGHMNLSCHKPTGSEAFERLVPICIARNGSNGVFYETRCIGQSSESFAYGSWLL